MQASVGDPLRAFAEAAGAEHPEDELPIVHRGRLFLYSGRLETEHPLLALIPIGRIAESAGQAMGHVHLIRIPPGRPDVLAAFLASEFALHPLLSRRLERR